jgi:hypothetical protein
MKVLGNQAPAFMKPEEVQRITSYHHILQSDRSIL